MKSRSKIIPPVTTRVRGTRSVRPAVVGAGALLLSAVLGIAQEATPAATPEVSVPPAKVNVDQGNLQRNPAGGPFTSFAPIIDKVAPSVVTIYTSKTIKRDPHANMFDEDTLRRFFGNRVPNPHNFHNPGKLPPNHPGGGDGDSDDDDNSSDDGGGNSNSAPQKSQGLGSGVVISDDGQILTNNHVVDGADEILVRFGQEGGGTKEYKAKRVGSDPSTDLAVLKIDAKNLPVVTFANSDKARVGDLVLAIGNPFALGQTVTMGIISATGRRSVGIADYENFIQTDASINPGNSGGALVDAEGRVVGINTAIFSRSGGNQGIGFAVPSNLVREVYQSIQSKGRVVRGYLGAQIQALDQKLIKQFKFPEDASGALVVMIQPDSPAEKAGIKPGDLITGVNGSKVADPRQLRLLVSEIAPGTKTAFTVIRDGKPQEFQIAVAELPASGKIAKRGGDDDSNPSDGGKSNVLDGISVGAIDADTRKTLKLPEKSQGAMITNIDATSAGYKKGLRQGDVIEEMNRQTIKDADEAINLSEKVEKDDSVLLRVRNKSGSRYIVLDPKEQE